MAARAPLAFALALAAAALAVIGCHSHDAPHTLASEAQCEAVHHKSRQLLAAIHNQSLLEQFDDMPRAQWMGRCRQRTTAGQARCQLRATSIQAMTRCKPEFDWRGALAPSDQQCRRLEQHAREVSASTGKGGDPAMVGVLYLRQCRRSLRTSEVACMMAATGWRQMDRCERDPTRLTAPDRSAAAPARPAETPGRRRDAAP